MKKNIIIRLLSRMQRILDRYVRFFVNLMPRNHKLIVYGGALDLFIDNAKHLFIYNINNELFKGYRQIWMTSSQKTYDLLKTLKLPVVKYDSLRGFLCFWRAGYIIYDNQIKEFASYNFSEGAKRIQLWHGLPLKMWGAVKRDDQEAYKEKSVFYEKFMKTHILGNYAICTAQTQKRIFSAAFEIPIEKIFVAAYPRTRCFFMDEKERQQFIFRYESPKLVQLYLKLLMEKRRVVIYMPTFRDSKPHYINEAIPSWNEINQSCQQGNTLLLLKVHRVTPLPQLDECDCIEVLDNSLDVYPLLPQVDCLITDYSSIMFDYSLMNKPVVLYTYDIDEYSVQSRNIYKFFWALREELTHVDDFSSLNELIRNECLITKKFPCERFFDTPQNYDAINRLILEM